MGILIFVLGTCLGSFYLVVGNRLPKEENLISSRSKCDNCGKTLKWWQLVPIISFLCLRGKCYYCKNKIGILNPLMELATGFLFFIGYKYFGISYQMYMFWIVSSLMLIIFISDFNYMIINDSPLVVASIFTIALKWYYFGYKEVLLSLLCGIILFLVMLLVKVIGDKIFKKESLGGGDIKFSFVIGLIATYKKGLCVLILSCFMALPYSLTALALKKNNEVPYGPFLAASLFVVFAFAQKFDYLLDFIFFTL